MTRSYYTLLDDDMLKNEAESQCNDNGKHLASVHSSSQTDLIIETCQCDLCWIGLEYRMNSNNITTYQWTDDTTIDAFIHQSWCHYHPQITNNNSHFVLIDPYTPCLQTTTNLSFKSCSICGPIMMDTTNGLYATSYIVIPIILSLIGIIYSPFTLCFGFLEGLNSFYTEWVTIPSITIKRTATLPFWIMFVTCVLTMIHSIFLYSAYIETDILPHSLWIDTDYPDEYMTTGYMAQSISIIYSILTVIIYTHVLLRLKHSFDDNAVFDALTFKVPCKDRWTVFWLLIFVYFFILLFMNINLSNGGEERVHLYFIITLCVVDIVINIFLLSLYIETLYKFKSYVLKERLTMTDEVIEFRRYTVLFIVLCVIHIVVTAIVMFCSIISVFIILETVSRYIKDIILIMFLYTEVIVSLHLIYLSFTFNHLKYKKWCHRCDSFMQKKCNEYIERRFNESIEFNDLSKIEGFNVTEKLKDIDNMVTLPLNDTYINYKKIDQLTMANSKGNYNYNNRDQVTIDDYLPNDEHQTESHPNIAKMQNAEDNIDAVNQS